MSTLGRAAFGIVVGLALAGMAAAQSLTEFGAAAAGGTVGGAAGKKVSDGLTTVLGKVDQQTKTAAKQDPKQQEKAPQEKPSQERTPSAPAASSSTISPAPASAASSPAAAAAKPAPTPKIASARAASRPAVKREVKREEPVSVPDPPALHSAAVTKAPPPEPPPQPVVQPAPIPPPPPPPEVTADALKSIAPGETRDEVLKLGPPSTRITMFGDNGHLVEIYSYMTKNTMLGIVRLSDGEVSKVELR